MRELTAFVAGQDRPIHVIEDAEDAEKAVQDIESVHGIVAMDTETSGLQIYSEGYRTRVVQFGTKEEAWVFPVEVDPAIRWAAIELLQTVPAFVCQNMSFDIRTLKATGFTFQVDLWEKTQDTYLMAHLLDPRGREDGGSGHGLEELSAAYFDPEALQFKDALFSRFRELGFSKDKELGWGPAYASIPIDDEVYLRYAGVDVLLASWLYDALLPLIVSGGFENLLRYENVLAQACGEMMDRGFLIDEAYLRELGPKLTEEAEAAKKIALAYGVDNVNSGAKVGEALEALGAPLEAKTKTGKWVTDKEVLEGLVASGGPWAPLATAVMVAKTAGSTRTKYVEKVLDARDPEGRIHADIRSLKARTARMAVANPPLQQLPSGDATIRNAFVAKPGHVIVAADLDQVELRVLAVLAEERKMMAAIRAGDDLHQITADAAGVDRRVGKMANFLMVYGGGAGKLARSAGIPLSEAKKVVNAYHRTFPGVKRYSRKIMERAEMGQRSVITPTGRHLPMDRSRVYAGLNYQIQSTARDVLGQGLIRMADDGILQYVLMVVHDETIAEVPIELADDIARRLGEAMTLKDFLGSGIDLTATGEVYGPRWGSGYPGGLMA